MNPNLRRSIASLLHRSPPLASPSPGTCDQIAARAGAASASAPHIQSRTEVRAQLASHGVNPGDCRSTRRHVPNEEARGSLPALTRLPAGGFDPSH